MAKRRNRMALFANTSAADTATSPWRHLPNAITLVRIALVVPLIGTVRGHDFRAALIVVAIAGASDALDGFLARQCGWRSWLGGVLDPLADKLLLIACFVSLYVAGVLPAWLMWLVVGRDLVIVAGATAYHFLIGRVVPQPSILAKLTTCIQIICVLGVLVHLSGVFDLAPAFIDALLAAPVVGEGEKGAKEGGF